MISRHINQIFNCKYFCKFADMLFESNNNDLSDKELDEAVTSHLKKLDALEIMSKLLEKSKLSPDSLGESYCNDCIASGDWDNSTWLTNPQFNQEVLNLSSILGSPDWKSKNVYSISNPSHPQSRQYSHTDKPGETANSNFLVRARKYLAEYQEGNGVSAEEYSFVSLLRVMGQATGKSFLALFYILVNVAPTIQILLFVLRFVLDKIVSILSLKDTKQKATKSAILGIQLMSIYICLFFIFGSIWIPILEMIFGIVSQIVFYD